MYRFNDSRLPWVPIYIYGTILWQMETYFVNEKREIHTIHRSCMAVKRCPMVPHLQVVGHIPKKYLPINLIDIHIRLYRCVKIWMLKTWRILVGRQFCQILVAPKFPSIWYMVFNRILVANVSALWLLETCVSNNWNTWICMFVTSFQ